MQQYERGTVAGGQVMQLDAIDLGSAGSNGLACSLSVSCGGEKSRGEHSQAQKKVQSTFHARLLTRGMQRFMQGANRCSYRSSAARSQLPSVAAASYVLWQKSSSAATGDSALRTSWYVRRNSPSCLL